MNLFCAAAVRLTFISMAVLAVSACTGFEDYAETELSSKPDARILVVGDSVMWWNAEFGSSVADGLSATLNEPVVNLAVPGAAISHADPSMAIEGLDIRAQYRDRAWAWVVVEGGANDLGDEGRARGCDVVLEELIAEDGTSGEIPRLVERVRSTGGRVVVMGYYELLRPALRDSFCGDALAKLTGRLEALARHDAGVLFVAMADVISPADAADYDLDGIHPSARSSLEIGALIGRAILAAERE